MNFYARTCEFGELKWLHLYFLKQNTLELLIQTIKQLFPLSDEDQLRINTLVHRKEIKQKAHILKEGSTCRAFYFIEKGLVHYCVNDAGEENATYFHKEGELVCDYSSFRRLPLWLTFRLWKTCLTGPLTMKIFNTSIKKQNIAKDLEDWRLSGLESAYCPILYCLLQRCQTTVAESDSPLDHQWSFVNLGTWYEFVESLRKGRF